jgi:AcrR family transcriptional regulator
MSGAMIRNSSGRKAQSRKGRGRKTGAPKALSKRLPSGTAAIRRGRPRKVPAEARRQAILDAALAIFAEKGFEAARLDDVAARAGIAKGTVYLYFRDKQTLFEELVRSAVHPILAAVAHAATAADAPASQILDGFFALFEKEVLATRRKLLLRLIISEGPRFPAIAAFYYREVVAQGLKLMRAVAERGHRQGEFAASAPARFPQLIVAPLILAVIWDALFSGIAPLDVGGLLRAHRELLTGERGRPS